MEAMLVAGALAFLLSLFISTLLDKSVEEGTLTGLTSFCIAIIIVSILN